MIGVNCVGKFAVVTGSSENVTDDIFTISYETTSGSVSWSRFSDGSAHGDEDGADVAVMPDGLHVAVAGNVDAAVGTDIVTIAYEV